MKRSKRWKTLERDTAEALGGRRVVEDWTLFKERPDVLVDDFRLVVDAKAYARFAHHALLDAVRRKYCQPGDVPVLVTKHAGQVGAYVTVPIDFLASLMNQVRSNTTTETTPQ
jgi:hypothetical protein